MDGMSLTMTGATSTSRMRMRLVLLVAVLALHFARGSGQGIAGAGDALGDRDVDHGGQHALDHGREALGSAPRLGGHRHLATGEKDCHGGGAQKGEWHSKAPGIRREFRSRVGLYAGSGDSVQCQQDCRSVVVMPG